MNRDDFDMICRLLRQRSGLVLSPDKAYLMESRLLPVARKWKLAGFEDLVKSIRTKPDEALVRDVVEAMTTNESFFFRDIKPFDQFKELVLPAMLKNRVGQRRLRIWSAACSSGQEPYSLAMILSEMASQLAGWTIEIVATDLSNEILTRAKEGVYSQFEVQRGLPVALLVKYFSQSGDRWQISPKIRSMVDYREFNLLTDPTVLGRFDVVFCRNVLIYFSDGAVQRAVGLFHEALAPGGYLFLGHAESLARVSSPFVPIRFQGAIVYQKPEESRA
jgi:chemotaxis protein methyltransferase CheR